MEDDDLDAQLCHFSRSVPRRAIKSRLGKVVQDSEDESSEQDVCGKGFQDQGASSLPLSITVKTEEPAQQLAMGLCSQTPLASDNTVRVKEEQLEHLSWTGAFKPCVVHPGTISVHVKEEPLEHQQEVGMYPSPVQSSTAIKREQQDVDEFHSPMLGPMIKEEPHDADEPQVWSSPQPAEEAAETAAHLAALLAGCTLQPPQDHAQPAAPCAHPPAAARLLYVKPEPMVPDQPAGLLVHQPYLEEFQAPDAVAVTPQQLHTCSPDASQPSSFRGPWACQAVTSPCSSPSNYASGPTSPCEDLPLIHMFNSMNLAAPATAAGALSVAHCSAAPTSMLACSEHTTHAALTPRVSDTAGDTLFQSPAGVEVKQEVVTPVAHQLHNGLLQEEAQLNTQPSPCASAMSAHSGGVEFTAAASQPTCASPRSEPRSEMTSHSSPDARTATSIPQPSTLCTPGAAEQAEADMYTHLQRTQPTRKAVRVVWDDDDEEQQQEEQEAEEQLGSDTAPSSDAFASPSPPPRSALPSVAHTSSAEPAQLEPAAVLAPLHTPAVPCLPDGGSASGTRLQSSCSTGDEVWQGQRSRPPPASIKRRLLMFAGSDSDDEGPMQVQQPPVECTGQQPGGVLGMGTARKSPEQLSQVVAGPDATPLQLKRKLKKDTPLATPWPKLLSKPAGSGAQVRATPQPAAPPSSSVFRRAAPAATSSDSSDGYSDVSDSASDSDDLGSGEDGRASGSGGGAGSCGSQTDPHHLITSLMQKAQAISVSGITMVIPRAKEGLPSTTPATKQTPLPPKVKPRPPVRTPAAVTKTPGPPPTVHLPRLSQPSPSLAAAPKRRARQTPAEAQFIKDRAHIAQELYAGWNAHVFNGQLPADLPLVWNPRLVATAGQVLDDGTKQALKANKQQRIPCRLELSSKILTSLGRLRCTLGHEMCHVAAWAIDHEYTAPHGPAFWRWAEALMQHDLREWAVARGQDPDRLLRERQRARKGTGRASRQADEEEESSAEEEEEVVVQEDAPLVITRLHTYETHMAFRWQCTNTSCAKVYKRHRNSIDTARHVCSKCKGRLLFVGKFSKAGKLMVGPGGAGAGAGGAGGGGVSPSQPRAPLNPYRQFVKEVYSSVKAAHPPGTPMPLLMKEVGAQWTARKALRQQQQEAEESGQASQLVQQTVPSAASLSTSSSSVMNDVQQPAGGRLTGPGVMRTPVLLPAPVSQRPVGRTAGAAGAAAGSDGGLLSDLMRVQAGGVQHSTGGALGSDEHGSSSSSWEGRRKLWSSPARRLVVDLCESDGQDE